MKKNYTLFVLLLISLISFAQEKDFNITFTVKGMENKIGTLKSNNFDINNTNFTNAIVNTPISTNNTLLSTNINNSF